MADLVGGSGNGISGAGQNSSSGHPTEDAVGMRFGPRSIISMVRNTWTMLRRWGANMFADPRRNLDHECGYPGDVIDPWLFQYLFERDPLGGRVVELYPKECWQITPNVYEDEDPDTVTPWEEAWNHLGSQLVQSYHKEEKGSRIWEVLERADIQSGIGSYGIILIGIDDLLPLDQPAQLRPYQPLGKGKGNKDNAGKVVDKADMTDSATGVVGTSIQDQIPTTTYTPDERPFNPYKTPVPLDDGITDDTGAVPMPVPSVPKGAPGQMGQAGQVVGQDEFGNPIILPPREGKVGADGNVYRNLTYLEVYPESQCRVAEWEQNRLSPRYGQPTRYTLTVRSLDSTAGAAPPMVQTDVHWTRVVHLADDIQSNRVQAAPRQRGVLHRILDARKIYGPDAEGYYKNGIPGWAFSTHPELGAPDLNRDTLRNEWEEYINSLSRIMAVEGGEMKPLTTPIPDPTTHINIHIEAICIKMGCPIRIFKGSERGELASSQDDAAWNDRLRKRQNSYLTPRVVTPFIDRLILLGVLPVPEAEDGYKVWWPDLESQGQSEKSTIAGAKVTAIATFYDPTKELFARMAPIDFWTKIMGFDDKEAHQIIDNAEKEKEKLAKEKEEAQQKQIAFQDQQARAGMERDLEFQRKQAEQQAVASPDDEEDDLELEGLATEEVAEGDEAGSGIQANVRGPFGFAQAVRRPIRNTFCPTGKGGGIDPTCGASSKGVGPGRGSGKIRVTAKSVKEAEKRVITKVDNSPREVSRVSLSDISELGKVRTVPLSNLYSDQSGVSVSRVKPFVDNPSLAHDPSNYYGVVRMVTYQGKTWIADGNHRVVAAKLRGDESIQAVVLDLDSAPITNTFCPTGKGGGVDPSCGGGKGGGVSDATRQAVKAARQGVQDTQRQVDQAWRTRIASAQEVAKNQTKLSIARKDAEQAEANLMRYDESGPSVQRAAARATELEARGGMTKEQSDWVASVKAEAAERANPNNPYRDRLIQDVNRADGLVRKLESDLKARQGFLDQARGAEQGARDRLATAQEGLRQARQQARTEAGVQEKPQGPRHDPNTPISALPRPQGQATADAPRVASSGPARAPQNVQMSREGHDTAQRFFRQQLSKEHVAAMVNAPDGAKVTVSRDGKRLVVQVDHDGMTATRTFSRAKDGSLTVHNDYLKIYDRVPRDAPAPAGQPNPMKQGGGGLAVFSNQVRALSAAGVTHISTHAAGCDGCAMNGYYTWPRFGYDAAVPKHHIQDLPKPLKEQMGNSRRVKDLMATSEGQAWWRKNGSDLEHAKFDLREGSESRKALDAYVAEKGGPR